MERSLHLFVWSVVLLVMAASATADEAAAIRLANGRTVPGAVLQVTASGLEIQTPNGKTRTVPWKILSAGTRFRYQPDFRTNFNAVLEGRKLSTESP